METRAARRMLRCSTVTQAMETQPTATAGSFDRVLLIERPLPWPADVGNDPELLPVMDHLTGEGAGPGRTRVQAVVPTGDSIEVALYHRPSGPSAAFERTVSHGDTRSSADRALALLRGNESSSTLPPIIEILVCTHGKRDACCGSLGPAVHGQLAGIYAGSDDRRVRRTSHLGGHRFAPTALLMPSGTLWAWVSAELMQGIVEQSAAIDVAVRHFRGAMVHDEPEVQALDAALLAELGWPWLERPRSGAVISRDGHETFVQIDHTAGDRRWTSTATVVHTGAAPIPRCGIPFDGSEKTQPQWRVTGISTTSAT